MLETGKKTQFRFNANEGCQALGIIVEPGARYQFAIENSKLPVPVHSEPWASEWRAYLNAQPGIWKAWRPNFLTRVLLPFRRFPTTPWFQPIVRVRSTGTEEYVLSSNNQEITLIRNEHYFNLAQLYIFVNDAVIGIPRIWDLFYRGNNGTGTLTVTKIADPPPWPWSHRSTGATGRDVGPTSAAGRNY